LDNGTRLEVNGGLLVNDGSIFGPTDVNFGGLVEGAGNYGAVNVTTGGVFQPGSIAGTTALVTALSGNGTVDNQSAGGTITLELNGVSTTSTFSGTIKNTIGSLRLLATGTGTQTLSGVDTYTGGTAVFGGTLVIAAATALPNETLDVDTGGQVRLANGIGGVTIQSLTITSSGLLDINNNHLFIKYGSGPDPISSIAALLATGYNSGSWNGAGIDTSAPLTVGGLSYGLGYADSADPEESATDLPSGTIEIKYTLLGDADLNGIVNGLDFGILAANSNKGVTGWDEGDFDYNNIVNGLDFGDLAANFNKGAAGADAVAALDAFAAANGLLADVPEPVTGSMLLIGAVGALQRRRRQSSN
jgi:autotransporter-associated beta strand protein